MPQQVSYAAVRAPKHKRKVIMVGDTRRSATNEEVRKGVFNDADLKELLSLHTLQVTTGPALTTQAIKQEHKNIVPCRFERVKKLKNNTWVCKSRFIAQGFKDTRDLTKYDNYTWIPNVASRRTVHIFALSQGWTAALTDIATAYLQAPLKSATPIYIKFPSKMVKNPYYTPGGVYRLNKALYGLSDSSKTFILFLRDYLNSHGWVTLRLGVYLLKQKTLPVAIMLSYVDDIIVWSQDPISVLNKIRKDIQMDEPTLLSTAGVLIGEDLQMDVGTPPSSTVKQPVLSISKDTYISTLSQDYSAATTHTVKSSDLQPPRLHEERLTNIRDVREYQRLVGIVGWLAASTPAVALAYSCLGAVSTAPTARHRDGALKVIRHAVLGQLHPQHFTGVKDLVVRLFNDASWNRSIFAARGGVLLCLHDSSWPIDTRLNIVYWKSFRVPRPVDSSAEAELHALRLGYKDCFPNLKLIKDLHAIFGSEKVKIELCIDARVVVTQLNTLEVSNAGINYDLLHWLKKHYSDNNITLKWIPTHHMLADGLTKHLGLQYYNVDYIVPPKSKKQKVVSFPDTPSRTRDDVHNESDDDDISPPSKRQRR